MNWDRKTVKFTPGQIVFDKEDKVYRQIDLVLPLDYERLIGEFAEPMYTLVGDIGVYVPECSLRALTREEAVGSGLKLPTGWSR